MGLIQRMRVCGSLKDCPGIGGPVFLAAGVFDGVHLGHQAVMSQAREEAARLDAMPGALTFTPHPAKVLAPARCPSSLTLPSQKRELIEELGMKVMIELPFTEEFAALGAIEFLGLLRHSLRGGLRGICAGGSWSFGRNRSGNMEFLKKVAPSLEFLACEVPPVMIGNRIVSSTRIRSAVAHGELDEARLCLGRSFCIRGTVQPGAQVGRHLGFPTANVSLLDQQLPPDGVYAGSVVVDGDFLPAAINLGRRPTVSKGLQRQILEAHVLDFAQDLYGKEVDVAFHKFLRDERGFSGPEELRRQIAADVEHVRSMAQSGLLCD